VIFHHAIHKGEKPDMRCIGQRPPEANRMGGSLSRKGLCRQVRIEPGQRSDKDASERSSHPRPYGMLKQQSALPGVPASRWPPIAFFVFHQYGSGLKDASVRFRFHARKLATIKGLNP